MHVVFFPIFRSVEDLTDHFYRLHWYLFPVRSKITKISIPYIGIDPTPGPLPVYLDSSLPQLARDFGDGIVEFVPVASAQDLTDLLGKATFVLKWNNTPEREYLDERGAQLVKQLPTTVIDHQHRQYAGSQYLNVAPTLGYDREDAVQRSRLVFERILERCQSKVGYIFGTGPSLSAAAAKYDFSDGVAIACNSMVRNKGLLRHIQPKLFVVGDPIFHAGCSSYAEAFRADLAQCLDEFDADLIVPARDIHIYSSHLPERFRDRIAAIPFKQQPLPNLDLRESYEVATTGNVLTLYLLPLAATFFDEINIFGCDGRPLQSNTYFWAHDKASQINEEMDNIRKAHPAFFAIDYDEYYLEHCYTLETWLGAVEAKGKRVTNRSQSFIPALVKRNAEGVAKPEGYTELPPKASPKAGAPASAAATAIQDAVGQRAAPTVSIVMPAFNAGFFLDEAIRSVRNQTFQRWELLIVNDASTDDTEVRIKRAAALDPRIRYLESKSKGVSAARNTGLKAAIGVFIGFLDADDSMDQGSIAARVHALGTHNGLVHGVTRQVDERNRPLGSVVGMERDLTFADSSGNPAHLNTVMGPASLIKRFAFDERFSNGEDWLFLARILRMGVVSKYVADAGATWRLWGNSTTQREMQRHIKGLRAVIDWVYSPAQGENIAPKFQSGLSDPPQREIILRNARNLLLWDLFGGHGPSAAALFQEYTDLASALNDLAAEDMLRIVRWQAARYFRRRITELREIEPRRQQTVLRAVEKAKISEHVPLMAETLHKLFGPEAAEGSGVVSSEIATVTEINGAPARNATVLIAYPTLRTKAEVTFWQTTCETLVQRGYNPVILSYFNSLPELVVEIDFATQYFLWSDGEHMAALYATDRSAANIKLKIRSKIVAESITWTSLERHKLRNNTGVTFEQVAFGWDVLSDSMDKILGVIDPGFVILNNDTYDHPLALEAACRERQIPYAFSERSPLLTQWFESAGFYTLAEAWKADRSAWEQADSYLETGKTVVELLRANPAMHRKEDRWTVFGTKSGSAPVSGRRKFLIALDATMNTGWYPSRHPKAQLNYPVYETPSAFIAAVVAVAEQLDADVFVKPHPSDPYGNSLESNEKYTVFRGEITEALDFADVVFTALSKVAFASLALQKPTVVVSPNIAAIEGSIASVSKPDELRDRVDQALAWRPTEADQLRIQRFFGWLDQEYFVSNDLKNNGAARILNAYFPPRESVTETAQMQPSNPGIHSIAGVVPRLPTMKVEGDTAPLYGPFARADRCGIDEVEVAGLLFKSGALQKVDTGMMIDVGACKGSAFRPFLKEGWTVHAFEPNPPMFDHIKKSATGPKLVLNQLAVSDVAGADVPFYTSEESIGISSLAPFRATHKPTAIVKTVRLDAYLDKHGVSQIDLLKVDTEGFDLMVLRGHNWAIKPQVIVAEFEDTKTKPLGYSTDDLGQYLASQGYDLYVSEWHPITQYGGGNHSWKALHRWRPGIVSDKSWGNFIAFRDPIPEEAVRKAVWKLVEIARMKNLKREDAWSKKGAPTPQQPKKGAAAKKPAKPNARRPVYADFGDWLAVRLPAVYRVLQRGRRKLARFR